MPAIEKKENAEDENVIPEEETAATTVDNAEDLVRKLAQRETWRLTLTLCGGIVVAYVAGYFQWTVLAPFLCCLYTMWIWNVKVDRFNEWFSSEHEMREHRRRAFSNAETCEWLNFLLNRWWFFSDKTIFELLKRGIDPVLENSKPNVIKSIELEEFTLGNRTPFFKYLRVYDTTDDLRKQKASDVLYRNPPPDLPKRPKYQVVLDMDMALDAPESKLLIRTKLNSKVGDVDIAVEKFQVRGRLQLVLYFNQSIAFPHLAAFSVSFLHPPKVNFKIQLMKKIQLMEFPLIRSWIRDLVNDSLKISLVDPGHVTIPLCNDPELLGRQTGYAAGVLTITIKGGEHGKATSDEQWCSVTLDKQKIRTKEIDADVQWKEEVSMLVHSVQYDKLRVKMKGKRTFGPNFTIVQYVLPLIRLNLEQDPEQDMHLNDDTIEGSDLYVHLDYSALPIIDVCNPTDQETFDKNFIQRFEQPDDVAGVLFVRVHNGINLIPMDSTGTSDPYVMIFANKDLVQIGHVVEESLNPEWDSLIEFFTLDYTQTTLSFIVQDQNPMVLKNVILADDNDDFMGSCNLPLTKNDWYIFKRELDLVFKFPGDSKRGLSESMRKVGKIVVSVVFRPISSIKNSVRPSKNAGMPLGEPLYQKRSKIDAVTMEAILCSERGSLTVCIFRARKLIALDLNGRSDPFVVVRMGSRKNEKYKTKIVYRTLNPVWNEQITMAMPQKHQHLIIEVWDKDPFSQEKMGHVKFTYDQLLRLGESDSKEWFTLQQAKSGEIQLSFKVEGVAPTEVGSVENLLTVDGKNYEENLYKSYDGELNDSDEDYLVLNRAESEKENGEASLAHAQSEVSLFPTDNELLESNEKVFEESDDHVDLSGQPTKYFGLHGEIIELIGIKTIEDIDEVYIKIKLDRHAKFAQSSRQARRSLLTRPDRVLCRTSLIQIDPRMQIGQTFNMKSDSGVSPVIYLVVEIKSEKKGKDVIDSHSMLLQNFFKGENPATRLIELDNGGKIKLRLGHVSEGSSDNNNFLTKRRSIFKKSTSMSLR